MKLKKIFGNSRIVGLAGDKNSGKTNNLVNLIIDYRKNKQNVPIYAYGMPKQVMDVLKKHGVKEISSIKHLIGKRDCIVILDEFQKLRLNDRRYKEALSDFVDFVYHNNACVILSSPSIREFNSVIGGVIEKWLLKSLKKDSCVNGSQLKKVVEDYKGRYKSLDAIDTPKNELLVINDEEEIVIKCEYVKEADNKLTNQDLF